MAYNIYTLGVPRAWPLRLLHIPSMTSREWKPGNIYGQDTEPGYSILSYTWGRFEVADGPRLHINGIDWLVPPIDESHFTVADLTRLLEYAMLKYEYIWIDTACIDQEREKIKMQEVGRQASIFKGARQAYVWLNKHEPEALNRSMQTLNRCGYDFAQGSIEASQVVEQMFASISHVLQDPWFSSLWTLQESVLQRHAILLNKRGQPVTSPGPWAGESDSCQLMDISGACAMAKSFTNQALQGFPRASQEGSLSLQSERLQSLRTMIDESGIDFMLCPNPNIQYAAARFRKTSHDKDRIYAIMQVYGYRLGNSAASVKNLQPFDLEDLELEFLKTLAAQSVVLSQTFQHLRLPKAGQSWCITNHIRVPKRFHNIIIHDEFVTSACTITVRKKDKAYFEGTACPLHEIFGFWNSRSQQTLTWLSKADNAPSDVKERHAYFGAGSYGGARYFKQAKQGMFMDCNDSMSFEWPPDTTVLDGSGEALIECRIPELMHASDTQQAIGESILANYCNQAPSVLYLGRAKYIESMDVALIIVREDTAHSGLELVNSNTWRRMGICFWNVEGGLVDDIANLLQPLEGKFG